jgi:hypothetical protein
MKVKRTPWEVQIITPLDVREYRRYLSKHRKLAPATVNNYLAGLRAHARWAQTTGRTEHDPTAGSRE